MPTPLPTHDDASPRYQQLARQLASDIRAGRYARDQALPSERMLSEALGLSRVTARKAIDALVDLGLVVRRHGAGNFVVPHLEQASSKLASFSDELRQRGYTPSSHWIRRSTAAATAAERDALGLGAGARVARLERLRLADGVPMALEHSVLPLQLLPHPASLDGSLYAYLATQGAAPQRARQTLRAINADGATAQHLGVAPGTALLWVQRSTQDAQGRCIEFTQSYCRSDYYHFVAELQSTP